jgi:hypothetical protein
MNSPPLLHCLDHLSCLDCENVNGSPLHYVIGDDGGGDEEDNDGMGVD